MKPPYPHQLPVHFEPLTEEEYTSFYEIEMAGSSQDIAFYRDRLAPGGKVLELGCGSGRLTRQLAPQCRSITGSDISEAMLAKARQNAPANMKLVQADMCTSLPDEHFDTIIIGYNTLNLLADKERVRRCLKLCRQSLRDDGTLLLQIYLPGHRLKTEEGKRHFQFTIFQTPDGGRLVKETLKCYLRHNTTVTLEERYRLRPKDAPKRDLRHTLTLFAPDAQIWFELLAEAGFALRECLADHNSTPFSATKETSTLMIAATLNKKMILLT